MEVPSLPVAVALFLALLASGYCKETAQNELSSHAGSSPHHQTQKRSALMGPDGRAALDDGRELVSDPGLYLLDPPYAGGDDDDDGIGLAKRNTLFRFGKRGSLFRFGKRNTLFRFGKRDGTLFRFGKRSGGGDEDGGLDREGKRTLFRFGKRSAELDRLLAWLSQYYLPAADDSDVQAVKRGVDSFHWGQEADK